MPMSKYGRFTETLWNGMKKDDSITDKQFAWQLYAIAMEFYQLYPVLVC